MILTILKIIGIVLLCILGFVLAVLILVLVLPVKYSINVSKQPDEKPDALIKVSYFLGLIRARAHYRDIFEAKAKIAWFTVFEMKIPDKDSDDNDEDLSGLDEALDEEFPDESDEEPMTEYKGDESEGANSENEVSGNHEYADNLSQDMNHDNNDETLDDISDSEYAHADDSSDDSGDEEDGIGSANGSEDYDEESEDDGESPLDKIKYKFSEIYDKIEKVRSEVRYYWNIYNSNEGKNSLYAIKKHLKKIFLKILPRKIKAKLTFGFSSPDLTGKIYGIYCLIAHRFTRDSEVIPDFENEIFEGKITAKGYFNLWGILINGLCIVLNRNVLKIIKSVKRHNSRKNDSAEESSQEAA